MRKTPITVSRLAAVHALSHLQQEELEHLARHLTHRDFEPDAILLSEGDGAHEMFFVLEGEARVVQHGVELARVRSGEHLGELGLITQQPRVATITATQPTSVAVLSAEGLQALSEDDPTFLVRLLRALFSGLGQRLREMDASVGTLLRERSLPRRAEIRVEVFGELRDVRLGTPAGELLPEAHEGWPVVAALVNHRAVSLNAPLSSDCTVEPLTTRHWEGQRIYRQSLGLLLLEASRRARLGVEVTLEQSIGFAQHVSFSEAPADIHHLAVALQTEMEALAERDLPLHEEWWTVEEARAYFDHRGWTCAASLLDTWRDATVPMVSYGDVYVVRHAPLLSRTGRMRGFRVVANFGHGLILMYGPQIALDGSDVAPVREPRPRARAKSGSARAISQHTRSLSSEYTRWLETVGITSVGEFNTACVTGDVSRLIRVSEGFQEKRLSHIADEIAARSHDLRVVCIAGPSSSGKTTFIKRLSVQLQVNGIHPVNLSLDDYFKDREETPRDASGEFDFEAFEALRSHLLQAHLARMLKGERVKTASFDFHEGRSSPEGGPEIALRHDDMLMLEGIHGLNPGLLEGIPERAIFRVFVCPLAQLPFDRLNRIHASDLRLLRRLIRDRHGRGHSAADTILRWPSVRRGERRNIYPYQHNNDAVFDTSLIYEPSVLKVFAERYLLEVPRTSPAYLTAFRMLQLLDRFVSIYPDHVPPTSIVREFIGESGFEY